MQSALPEEQGLNLVPFIETPSMYAKYFSKSPQRGDFFVLTNHEKNAGESAAELSTTTQIGGGSNEVQLVSPTEAEVERAQSEMKRQHISKEKVRRLHSLIGGGRKKAVRKAGGGKGKKSGSKKTGSRSAKSRSKGRRKTSKSKKKKVQRKPVKRVKGRK